MDNANSPGHDCRERFDNPPIGVKEECRVFAKSNPSLDFN
jgi:hypothetical protein